MSSQTINNITIAFVPNDKAVIALMLEYLQLCKVRKICVFPDFQRNQMCYTAFIEVAEWCDREAAHNLIRKIKDPSKEARIVYEDDNWWVVEETEEADLRFTQNPEFAKWTTEFQQPIIKVDDDDESQPKKQVRFKRGLQIEEVITIEDLDARLTKDIDARLTNGFNFNDFCTGFGLAHGFDFEAEFQEWKETQNFPEISEEEMARHNAVLEAEFEELLNSGATAEF
jgi:hypothetical protein